MARYATRAKRACSLVCWRPAEKGQRAADAQETRVCVCARTRVRGDRTGEADAIRTAKACSNNTNTLDDNGP